MPQIILWSFLVGKSRRTYQNHYFLMRKDSCVKESQRRDAAVIR